MLCSLLKVNRHFEGTFHLQELYNFSFSHALGYLFISISISLIIPSSILFLPLYHAHGRGTKEINDGKKKDWMWGSYRGRALSSGKQHPVSPLTFDQNSYEPLPHYMALYSRRYYLSRTRKRSYCFNYHILIVRWVLSFLGPSVGCFQFSTPCSNFYIHYHGIQL
jgi:hypothetical protein